MMLAFTFAVAIGLLLGLLGGGGSLLTLPVLVYVLDIAPKQAIPMSLVVVGLSSLVALWPLARRGWVCWKSGLLFGSAGMVGAYCGGVGAAYFSEAALMGLFALTAATAGMAMLLKDPKAAEVMPGSQSGCPRHLPWARLTFDGLLVGVVTGLVGVGGGFLIVPALTLLLGLPMHAAVGTSLWVIALNAAAGLLGHSQHNSIPDGALIALISSGAVAGSLGGGYLSSQIDALRLRRAFASLVLAVAGFVLAETWQMDWPQRAWALLVQHYEFFLGVLSLGGVLLTGRIWCHLHRSSPRLPGRPR